MNSLLNILKRAVRAVNAANGIKLRKLTEYGSGALGAGVYFDKDHDEYRVLFVRDDAHLVDADYHTDDMTDAFHTAEAHVVGETVNASAAPGWDRVDTSVEATVKLRAVEPEQEQLAGVVQRPRPRGYNAPPSDLLMNILRRV
jgi:hypothetical protein